MHSLHYGGRQDELGWGKEQAMESVGFFLCGKLLNNQSGLKCVKITVGSEDILTLPNSI